MTSWIFSEILIDPTSTAYRKNQDFRAWVRLVKLLLSVSGVTLEGLASPTIPAVNSLAPPTSHALLWVGRRLNGNTCRYYSLVSSDASSRRHSFTRLPVWWWQLPTHLFTKRSHFLFGCCTCSCEEYVLLYFHWLLISDKHHYEATVMDEVLTSYITNT